ncbi:MAG: PKD domain-containing protein [bacterium]|nr:PKD domain-containing protein [bacterium]
MDSTKSSYPFSVSLGQKVIYSADGTKMYGVSPSYHIGDGGGRTPYLDINVFGPADYQCTAVNLDELELSPEDCPPPELVQTKNQNGLANLFSIAKAASPGQCWGRGIYCSVKYPWFIKRAELYTLDTDKPDNYNRCRMRINVVDKNGEWINQGLLLPAPTSRPEPTEEENGREREVFNENNQNFSFQDLFKNLVANFRDLIPKSLAQILYDSVYGSLSNFQVCGYETGYWAQARAMPVNETLASAGARLEATVNGNWGDIVGWDGQVRYWGERMLMKSFSVDKTIIHPEEAVTLNWEVLNAALSDQNYPEVYVFIGDAQCAAPYNCQPNSKFFVGKEIGEKGSLTVYPNQTTNFYLIAKGASGEGLVYFISESALVTILPGLVNIQANPDTVDYGDFSTITWSTNDLGPVVTCNASAEPALASWFGNVDSLGSELVGPFISSTSTGNSTTPQNIILTCTGALETASSTAVVNVGGECDSSLPNPNQVCVTKYAEAKSYCNLPDAQHQFSWCDSSEVTNINTITTKGLFDGSDWSGNVSYSISGPQVLTGQTLPQTFTNVQSGNYIVSYISGGPENAIFDSITPVSSLYLVDGGGIVFTLNFKTITGLSHKECNASSQCITVVGEGADTCTDDASCTSGTHKACNASDQCVSVAGSGVDQCTDDVSCTSGTHKACNASDQCVSVAGSGSDQCINDTSCALPPLGFVCNFSWSPESPKARSAIDFFDYTQTPEGTTLTSWEWTFEGGTPASSSEQNPGSVIFNSAGEKTVTLRVTNSDNDVSTLSREIIVQSLNPKWIEVLPK